MRKTWWNQDDPNRNGWSGSHFFIKGSSICQKWMVDLRNADNLANRPPRFIKKGWKPRDCKICTRGWLELYATFKKVDSRIFP